MIHPILLIEILIWVFIGIGELIFSILIFSRLILPALFKHNEVSLIAEDNEAMTKIFTSNVISISIGVILIICGSMFHSLDYFGQVITFFIGIGILFGVSILVSRVIVPLMTSLDEEAAILEEKKVANIFAAVNCTVILSISIIFLISLIT